MNDRLPTDKAQLGSTQRLVKEVIQAKFADIPTSIAERVTHGILDDVGIAFLGYSMAGGPLIEYAKDIGGGRPESTLIGDGSKVSCVIAASVNAQMAYDTDFNETGPGHHILSALAQTALAVGERVQANGRDIITAVAIGYEMSGRFQAALLPPDSIGGTQGKRHIPITVAMTAGKLLGLNAVQLNHAIGIAWYFQPQPSEFNWRNIWWKRLGNPHIGFCHLGIQAALLAQKGFEGPIDIIDKEVFYDLDRLTYSPSPYHYPAKRMHLKPWIASRECHPGIQGTLELLSHENLIATDIDEIQFNGLGLYLDYPFNNPEPTEYWNAIYSVQWAFAMAILGYQPGPDWYAEERFEDPEVLALTKKIRIYQANADAEEEYSRGSTKLGTYPNNVEIHAKGNRYIINKSGVETLGSPENPMPIDQLVQKFRSQSVPIIGDKQSALLVDSLLHLDHQDNLAKIASLYKSQSFHSSDRL